MFHQSRQLRSPDNSIESGSTSLEEELRATLPGHPRLASIVLAVVAEGHPLNLSSALSNAIRRGRVLNELAAIANFRAIDEAEFQTIVSSSSNLRLQLFSPHPKQFKVLDRCGRLAPLREFLLQAYPELYAISVSPSPAQLSLLREYAARLEAEVLPSLRLGLRAIAGPAREDGYPLVNTRTKSAEAILDKIDRMRSGFAGRAPRAEYCLADMPDAVGGRITVTLVNIAQLENWMQRIEAAYSGKIAEVDSFYGNKCKNIKPYRVVTYTILVDSVPCELQLTTLPASIAADLAHNTIYKEYVKLNAEDKKLVNEFWRKATVRELESLF